MIKAVKTADGIIFGDTDRPGREYTRLIAGLGWPGAKPGAAVVVGEQSRYPVEDVMEYHVLKAIEDPRLPSLLDRAMGEIVAPFKVSRTVAFMDLGPHVQLLRWWNRERRQKGLAQLRVSPAPHSDEEGISFHLELVRSLMRPGEVRLFFENGTSLPGRLQELPDDPTKLTASEHPAAAALAYCVSYLLLHPARHGAGTALGVPPRQTGGPQYDPKRHGLSRWRGIH